MYKKKEFSLDQYYNDHHYTGIMGFLMRYCHKNLEIFISKKIYSKVLEIGAGTVTHLSYIKHKFDSYYVAETSDFAVNHWRDKIASTCYSEFCLTIFAKRQLNTQVL